MKSYVAQVALQVWPRKAKQPVPKPILRGQQPPANESEGTQKTKPTPHTRCLGCLLPRPCVVSCVPWQHKTTKSKCRLLGLPPPAPSRCLTTQQSKPHNFTLSDALCGHTKASHFRPRLVPAHAATFSHCWVSRNQNNKQATTHITTRATTSNNQKAQ